MPFAIFPIGGKGVRFQKAGYAVPKPFIKIFEKTQLEWSILSCIHNYPDFQIVIGCREQLLSEAKELTDAISKRLNIEILVLNVGRGTRGAAHTTKIALELLNPNSEEFEFLVLDNDVAVDIPVKSRLENTEGFLVTTFSSNPAHSYVVTDENGFVQRIAEKEVISEEGVIGNYFFKSNNLFLDAYERMEDSRLEEYISGVIQVLLNSEKKIHTRKALTVVSFGTPEEIDQLSKDSFNFLDKIK
jgi:NDP-sugar pyrophosphorylase family protein